MVGAGLLCALRWARQARRPRSAPPAAAAFAAGVFGRAASPERAFSSGLVVRDPPIREAERANYLVSSLVFDTFFRVVA